MTKKPRTPAPSKSFIRTKEEQQEYMEARQRKEADLIARLEGAFDKMEREEAKARVSARAQAKALNLSAKETQAFIKDAVEGPLQGDNTRSIPAWIKRRKVRPVSDGGELALQLSQLLEIGKRD
jgi:hypothetical protein